MANRVITISRQFGSGGRTVGRMTAMKLGIPCYDQELIQKVAEESGFAERYIQERGEEFSSGGWLTAAFTDREYNGLSLQDSLWLAQRNVILDLAKKGPCVIVGRCADYILRDHPELVSVFVHANSDFRAARIAEEYKLPDAKVRDLLVKTDKKRANYYNFQSEKQWGAASSYNLCIESSEVGIDGAVDLIMDYINYKKKAKG